MEAGALVLADRELIRLARLAAAGLPVVERRDGGPVDTDRLLVEQLLRAAEQVLRRSRTGGATPQDAAGAERPLSATTWLGTTEAGAAYGVSPAYIRRLASSKRLRAELDGKGSWRVDAFALEEWAASRNRC